MKDKDKVLYCFVLFLLVFGCVCFASAQPQDIAKHLLLKAGITKGICSLPDCGDGSLAVAVARQSDFLVHGQDTDLSLLDKARKAADKEGLLGKTVVVEKGSVSELFYTDNLVDLVLLTNLTDSTLKDVSLKEILRVLRPKGKAILGHASESAGVLTVKNLERLFIDSKIKNVDISEDAYGIWAVITKPALKGVDSWSHWAHGPDNNPVSTDTVIKWPYMTQWMAKPYYVTKPVVTTAAGGRTFTATGHIVRYPDGHGHKRESPTMLLLTARNGYNGRVLWTRKFPEGYVVHRSAFVATNDTFYMIDGNGCLMLDPETGEKKGRIQISDIEGEWRWIAL